MSTTVVDDGAVGAVPLAVRGVAFAVDAGGVAAAGAAGALDAAGAVERVDASLSDVLAPLPQADKANAMPYAIIGTEGLDRMRDSFICVLVDRGPASPDLTVVRCRAQKPEAFFTIIFFGCVPVIEYTFPNRT